MSEHKIYQSKEAESQSYNRRLAKKSFIHDEKSREVEKTFILFCEGTKTEPNYFKRFPVLSAQIKTVGTAHNTMSLIRYGEDYIAEHPGEYDEIWFVFDKDSFSDRNFNDAVKYCENRKDLGYYAAYSNEAFELWYLLHFEIVKQGVSRFQYRDMLTKRLGKTYKKNDTKMYEALIDRQPIAIKNAKALYQSANLSSPAKVDPLTSVHILVTHLNDYIR